MLIKEGVIHRGRLPRWITPSEICKVLYILPKPNSLIALLFIQNNSQFENKLKHAYLRQSQVHLDSACLEDKGCSGLQIYSKQQTLSVELSSCYVFRQQFVVKRVKCSADCSAIFLFTTTTTQPRPQVFTVNGSLTCNCAALLTSLVD